jgi:acryloyl-coenzyme A reductase
MRALVVREPGPPSVLRLEDVPCREPGRREVRIAVAACGVCFHDVVTRNGIFRRGVAMPVIPGHEIAGVVEKLGAGVVELSVGDRVATTTHSHVCGRCRFCRSGEETSCDEAVFLGDAGLNGGYAEYVCVDADAAIRLPDGIGFEEAAIAACAIGTELNAIRDVGRVQIGERVLVTGAGGGIGLHGIQIARLAGAFVIGVTTSAAKEAAIRAAGADEVIVVARGEDFSAAARRIAGGRGVDAVIDNVGSAVFPSLRKSLAEGGRIVLVGQVSGDFVQLSLAQLFLRNASLLSAKGVSRSQLLDVLDLVARGKMKPVVSDAFALADGAKAHERVESGRSTGRVILRPAR